MSVINRSFMIAGLFAAIVAVATTHRAWAQAGGGAAPAVIAQTKQKPVATAPRRAKVVRNQPVQTAPAERCDNLLCKFFVILGVAY